MEFDRRWVPSKFSERPVIVSIPDAASFSTNEGS
jgi:hypothetical protein